MQQGRGGWYFLTWTTHGTWLPGDQRGFVGRVPDARGVQVIHNQPRTPYDRDMPEVAQRARNRMSGAEVVLTPAHARVCAEAFVATIRDHALDLARGAILRTHVHLVVRSPSVEGPGLLQLFKGASARRLTQAFGTPSALTWWTRHGSRRLLRGAPSLLGALRYVRDQPGPLLALRGMFPRALRTRGDHATPARAEARGSEAPGSDAPGAPPSDSTSARAEARGSESPVSEVRA